MINQFLFFKNMCSKTTTQNHDLTCKAVAKSHTPSSLAFKVVVQSPIPISFSYFVAAIGSTQTMVEVESPINFHIIPLQEQKQYAPDLKKLNF